MVNVSLGQTGVIQENAAGENEVYFHTNGLPGSFYVLDAETGKVKFTEVTPNSEAVWAMTIGPDKNIYFTGTSDKKLYRYLPIERRIEYLGSNPSDGWVGDLEATSDGKIYGGTYASDTTGGKVFEYDIASGAFQNYGAIKMGQDYARGIGADDEYIYVGLGINIHLFKIDRVTGLKSEIIIPQNSFGLSTGDTGTIYDVFIVNKKIFVSINKVNMIVIDINTQEVLNTFKFNTMISGPSPYNPDIIYYVFETKLYQYHTRLNQYMEVKLPIPLPDAELFNDMQWIEMKSGDKKGKKVLAMVNQYGNCVFYDPTDNWLYFVDLEINPEPVRIQAIKRGMDGRIYFGGYQRGMSIYNPFTNKIDLTISPFPQPEGIYCLNSKVYYGTYVGAVMYSFDPTEPAALNMNPKKVYKIGNQQDRPFAITSGDNKLFVGTIPDYGFLGGSLAIYDEMTYTWSQYDDVVENQSICSLAYKDGLLYGSTTVWGGLGIQPKAAQAKLFVWDVKKNTKVDEFTLDIPGIDIPPKMIGDISFGPDGLLWGVVEGTIFAMNTDTKEIVKSRMICPSLYNSSKWKAHDIVWGPDGIIYTTLARKVMAIDPKTLRHKTIVDCSISDMVLGIDGSIYYAPESGTRLSRIAIPETDATLAGIYLNGVLLEEFSPGKLEYDVSICGGKSITATTTQEGATATVIKQGSSDQPVIIQVVAPDGKSKLEYRVYERNGNMGKKDKNLLGLYDSKMRPNERFNGAIRWYSPLEQPFHVAGLAWFAKERKYRRLPTVPSKPIPKAVDHMANHTAGGQIRFQSDSSSLSIRVKLKDRADMVHMPATGQCGIDCYVGSPDTIIPLQYANTTKYDVTLTEYECALFTKWKSTMRSIVLNLPLYQGVEEIWIGLDENAAVIAPPDYVSNKKVIVYGTSITQGGCASRPGMVYTNILSRRIPLEFINLGFSGNGKGEPEVAEIISQIKDPACLYIDYEGNCVSTELFRKTLPEFIRIYREVHPVTPILVASRIRYAREELTPHLYEMRMERKGFEQSLVNELREKGDLNIYFFDGSKSLGDEDFFECTVDGSHPTDLGFLRMANAVEPVLKTLLL